jgi:hypothetical protein
VLIQKCQSRFLIRVASQDETPLLGGAGVKAKLAGSDAPASCVVNGDRVAITFTPGITIAQGQKLSVEIA